MAVVNNSKKTTKRICSIDGCEKPHDSLGYCSSHANRLRRYGDPLAGSTYQAPRSTDCCEKDCNERRVKGKLYCTKHLRNGTSIGKPMKFLKKLVSNPPQSCVEWPFGKDPSGYGHIVLDGRKRGAHRTALILYTKKDPEGLVTRHGNGCDRSCVNPLHLQWGTHADNSGKDKLRDGTIQRGEKHFFSCVSDATALKIYKDPRLPKEIFRSGDFSDASFAVISQIKNGSSRSWLTGHVKASRKIWTEEEILCIYNDNRSPSSIAVECGMSPQWVCDVKHGRVYTYFTNHKKKP